MLQGSSDPKFLQEIYSLWLFFQYIKKFGDSNIFEKIGDLMQ